MDPSHGRAVEGSVEASQVGDVQCGECGECDGDVWAGAGEVGVPCSVAQEVAVDGGVWEWVEVGYVYCIVSGFEEIFYWSLGGWKRELA